MSPGTDCLTSGGPELGTATIRTLRREPQQDGPGTTHTRFSGCVPAEKCRTGWKCGNRKKCHNGNYLTGTWIPHELLDSDVNLSTGCQCWCERASTCLESFEAECYYLAYMEYLEYFEYVEYLVLSTWSTSST